MFKKALIVVGTLLMATAAADGSADARGLHRSHRLHVASAGRVIRRARRTRAAYAGTEWHRRGDRTRLALHCRRQRFASRDRFSPAPAASIAASGALVETGRASYYGGGGRTAAGGHVGAATCAHRSLPFGTRVLVTNLANARHAVLTVNDRGPFVRGRMLDVSRTAAAVLGMIGSGVAHIRMEVVGRSG